VGTMSEYAALRKVLQSLACDPAFETRTGSS
jgi:hypothetical protein